MQKTQNFNCYLKSINKTLFNHEGQLVNYISLQVKYIHKEIFSILLKESRVMLNATTVIENSNLLIDEDIEILQLMCIPIVILILSLQMKKENPK